MSVVMEGFSPGMERSADQYVDFLRSLDSNGQLLATQRYATGLPIDRPAKLRAELTDFAADTAKTTPLSVRLNALERALEPTYLNRFNPYEDDYALTSAQTEPQTPEAAAYRHLSRELIIAEGLDETIWFPPLSDAEIDANRKDPDYNPAYAYRYLRDLEQELRAGPQVSDEARRFAPLIQAIHTRMAERVGFDRVPAGVRLEDWADIHNCASLLEYGDNYRRTLAAILERDTGVEREYVRIVSNMNHYAECLAYNFPLRYQQGVVLGFRRALADALYGVLDHVDNGDTTDTNLELQAGAVKLPLQLHGDEPLELLEALHTTVMTLANVGYIGFTKAMRVTKSTDFSLLRLLQDGGRMMGASVYIRPEGGEVFDPRYEYGRNGEGVEASISYVVDAGYMPGNLSQVGKYRGRGNDKRISIRLDREGVRPDLRASNVQRDPKTPEGTLSLDVGSIIGDDQWLSTKLGRFLAHGNVLRTRVAAESASLNHVVDYFTPEDGRADVFAAEARQLVERLMRREMIVADLDPATLKLPPWHFLK